MKIIHRISIKATQQDQRELAGLGVLVPSDTLVTFEVDESQRHWSAIEEWVARRQALDVVRTAFSSKEIARANWLELVPSWHHGYPQPNDDNAGYRSATYDVDRYCRRCGIGLRQKAAFQMEGEPAWGRQNILQLNWIFDEFFVTPDVWQTVFAPHKVAKRLVVDTKGVELRTVVQLVIEEEVGIDAGNGVEERCAECGRVKFHPITRGPFPALVDQPRSAIAKTREYFGSGAAAHKRIIVAGPLARTAAQETLRGASFRPVKESGSS